MQKLLITHISHHAYKAKSCLWLLTLHSQQKGIPSVAQWSCSQNTHRLTPDGKWVTFLVLSLPDRKQLKGRRVHLGLYIEGVVHTSVEGISVWALSDWKQCVHTQKAVSLNEIWWTSCFLIFIMSGPQSMAWNQEHLEQVFLTYPGLDVSSQTYPEVCLLGGCRSCQVDYQC